jgi:two-component system, chemotaxis family, protein-glutamate methylesterase/glutaminase
MKRDLIVIGASSGGIKPLQLLLSSLPFDFKATILIVMHVSPDSPGTLAGTLGKYSHLRVQYATDGLPFLLGQAYIAPADLHLTLELPAVMRTLYGPRENRFRPAIDVLFRSAASHFGPRVIGVVLSGRLDDGAAGLHDIKRCGGIAVVQDPTDAEATSMPMSAIRGTSVDHVVRAAEMAGVLCSLVKEDLKEDVQHRAPEDVHLELKSAQVFGLSDEEMDKLGKLAPRVCPDCGGPLWQIQHSSAVHFRCHVGHSYSPEALAMEQALLIERSLATVLRSLLEWASLAQEMAVISENQGDEDAAMKRAASAKVATYEASLIRLAISRLGKLQTLLKAEGR